jgi:large subunit ribosomal protein L19
MAHIKEKLLPLHPLCVISAGLGRHIASRKRSVNIKALYKMNLMKIAEDSFATQKKEHPVFKSGDTVTVAYRIAEGSKERIQQYRGVVIKINGHGDSRRFTVRKMSDNIGVERIFPLNSPFIESITVNSRGKVRRAKLYYLRKLRGKAARIKKKGY